MEGIAAPEAEAYAENGVAADDTGPHVELANGHVPIFFEDKPHSSSALLNFNDEITIHYNDNEFDEKAITYHQRTTENSSEIVSALDFNLRKL